MGIAKGIGHANFNVRLRARESLTHKRERSWLAAVSRDLRSLHGTLRPMFGINICASPTFTKIDGVGFLQNFT